MRSPREGGNGAGDGLLTPLAIEARGVSKHFGRLRVLDQVGFAVAPGSSLAIIGANGCGKSTLLKICAGMMSPTEGTVTVRGRLGYCPQASDLSQFLTPDEHFTWFGAGRNLGRAESVRAAAEVATSLDWQVTNRQARHLSGGTAQKLNVSCTLMSAPEVILLDEPYQGFDEGSYLNFWDLVSGWCAAGSAVVIVTHMLRELHRVDDVLDLGVHRAAA